MNILWLSHFVPYPPKTGVLQRSFNLLKEASRYGNVYLVSVLKEDVLPGQYDVELARRALSEFCKEITIVQIPIESSRFLLYTQAAISLFAKMPLSVRWVKSHRMHEVIKRRFREIHFDLVHFDTISLAIYKTLVSSGATVLNHHNIESALLERRRNFVDNPLKRLYYQIEEKKLLHYEQEVCATFDSNFVVSELDGERLRMIAPSVVSDVVPNGVDIDYFRSNEARTRSGNLIMVSGMNWFPNRDAVLYACEQIWPLFVEKWPDISWTIVGASPPQQIVDLANQDSRVTVTGFVNDVRPYLAEAEIYLCPMRDGGGTRLKILDAMSMQKAVVATTMACEGIDVTPEKNVLIADTPQEFVVQVERLRSDPALRKRLGAEARDFVSGNYSWQVVGEEMRSVFDRLVSKKGVIGNER